jgi:hypothetical protein
MHLPTTIANQFDSRSFRRLLDTTSCDTLYQWFAQDRRFSLVASTSPQIKRTATIKLKYMQEKTERGIKNGQSIQRHYQHRADYTGWHLQKQDRRFSLVASTSPQIKRTATIKLKYCWNKQAVTKSIHIYMTADSPGLAQALHEKVAELN